MVAKGGGVVGMKGIVKEDRKTTATETAQRERERERV